MAAQELVNWLAVEQDPLPYARLLGRVERGTTELTIEITLTQQPNNGERYRKQIRLNGVNKRAMDMLGQLNVVLFLPLVGFLAAFLTRLVPQKPVQEAPHLTYLNVRMFETPALGIEQSKKEILRMGENVEEMLELLQTCFASPDRNEKIEAKVFHREELLDIFQKEVVEFLSGLLTGNVPHEVMNQARGQLRIADEYESIGDYIESILRLHIKLGKTDLVMSPEGKKEIAVLHGHVTEYLKMIKNAVEMNLPEALSKANTRGETISHAVRDSRRAHIDRVESGEVAPLKSLIYTDMLNAYRRIKDHGLNIAEVVAGLK